jgi:serine/threonine protein kinase HipA of HipAB toxin-antitoxin module
VVVGELLEADLVSGADVVDQSLDWANGPRGLRYELPGRGRLSKIADDSEGGTALLPRTLDTLGVAAADDDARPLVREQLRGREADAPGRAGDDAHPVTQAEIQGRVV